MIYRAITYYYLYCNIMPDNLSEIEQTIDNLNVKILFVENNQNIIINDINCTPYVSNQNINENVSLFSQILSVRHKVLYLQRDFASKNDIVIEGRDIGTEVFPNAEYKFYVTCDNIVRAKRRFEDLKITDPSITLEEVIKSLENRDYIDKTRKYSPLIKPQNAIEIDTSYISIEQTVNLMLSYIK